MFFAGLRTPIAATVIAVAVVACSHNSVEDETNQAARPVAARASAETAIRRSFHDPSTARFRDEQTFEADKHAGLIVCGVFGGPGFEGGADFVWGSTDSISPGLKTLATMGPDAFSALQIAACTDTPGEGAQPSDAAQNQQTPTGSVGI